jgi:hypothetical protein
LGHRRARARQCEGPTMMIIGTTSELRPPPTRSRFVVYLFKIYFRCVFGTVKYRFCCERFSSGPRALRNSVSGGEKFGIARAKRLQRAKNVLQR